MLKDIKVLNGGIYQTNCYFAVDENNNCAIIDCDGDAEEVSSFLSINGLKPVCILLTHGHFDHIGAVDGIREKYKIKVYASENEVKPEGGIYSVSGRRSHAFVDAVLKDGDCIKAGNMEFKAINTPGHTKGCMCYMTENKMFSGDTLFYGDCGRCDLEGGDWNEMLVSLRRLKALEGDFVVYPGHGPATTLERERRSNRYMNAEK